jgi:hypothetical protein
MSISDLGAIGSFLASIAVFVTLVYLARQREWEWLLHKDGVFPEDVYQTYVGVITLFFGTERTRKWWDTVGKTAIHPKFAAEVDKMIASSPLTDYWKRSTEFSRTGGQYA